MRKIPVSNNQYRLTMLVIKPTLKCTANCVVCALRKHLHRSSARRRMLSFEQWQEVLRDAKSLGCRELTISGGEPTLYKQLPALIQEGSRLGFLVKLNSNGSNLNPGYAEELIKAGLNAVRVSIYSHVPEIHNTIRRSKNLWAKACETVRTFAKLRKKYPEFLVKTQSVILKENFLSLDKLVRLHYELGSVHLLFSYIEGDFEKKYLLTEEEILLFRNQVLPKMLEFCSTLNPTLRRRARRDLGRIYHPDHGSVADFSEGIYWTRGSCKFPKKQALILATGDVHPCNIVEYTHEPVMGNLFEQRLPQIWQSEKWDDFRRDLHSECPRCPMNWNPHIWFRPVKPRSSVKRWLSGWLRTKSRKGFQ